MLYGCSHNGNSGRQRVKTAVDPMNCIVWNIVSAVASIPLAVASIAATMATVTSSDNLQFVLHPESVNVSSRNNTTIGRKTLHHDESPTVTAIGRHHLSSDVNYNHAAVYGLQGTGNTSVITWFFQYKGVK